MRARTGPIGSIEPRYAWLGRSAVLAVIMIGHLALLMALLRPPTPTRSTKRPVTTASHDAIAARLIPASRDVTAPTIQLPSPSTPAARRKVQRKRDVPAVAAASPAPMEARPAAPPATTLPQGSQTGTAYVPGGTGFRDNFSKFDAPVATLPGHSVRGAPQFRMADPTSQGVGVLLVRILGGLAGAADPKCVDADALGAMTEEERIARHTTASDVQRIAIEHNCPLPPSAQGRQ
ncbi:hypothetical protein [Dyella sp. 20L07]|uniref:hypothetical protein n=1 Tax=Dyella sp. 20L07 TaxID=3384240 RepID=UPI003D2B4FFB